MFPWRKRELVQEVSSWGGTSKRETGAEIRIRFQRPGGPQFRPIFSSRLKVGVNFRQDSDEMLCIYVWQNKYYTHRAYRDSVYTYMPASSPPCVAEYMQKNISDAARLVVSRDKTKGTNVSNQKMGDS